MADARKPLVSAVISTKNSARYVKRWVLEKAFKAIPKSVVTRVVHHDHAIIYYEA